MELEERASQKPFPESEAGDLDMPEEIRGQKQRPTSEAPGRPSDKKQRISAAVQEDFAYYLQEGNFYQDYAYSVQEYNETKEEDELIVLEIPVNNEHAFMNYMDDPSNFAAST